MSCCGQGRVAGGHFGAYVPVTPRQVMTQTGPVQGSPNETAGMHVQYAGARTAGLGQSGDLIPGIPNMYLWIFGGVLAVILITR